MVREAWLGWSRFRGDRREELAVRDTTPKAILDMLAAVPLFSACTPSELRSIANLGTQVSVADGTKLTTQGRPGMEFFLVVDGEVRCLVDGEGLPLCPRLCESLGTQRRLCCTERLRIGRPKAADKEWVMFCCVA